MGSQCFLDLQVGPKRTCLCLRQWTPAFGRPFRGWLASLFTRYTGEIIVQFPFLGTRVDAILQVDPINNPTQASKVASENGNHLNFLRALIGFTGGQEEACLIKAGGPSADG